MSDEKTKIVTTFDKPAETEIPVDVTALQRAFNAKAIQKAKRKMDLVEAREFAKLGAKIIKTKTTIAAMLGKHACRLGVKDLGHGRLLAAADNADKTLEELDVIIQETLAKNPNSPGVLVSLYQLKRDFNRQLIETAAKHLEVDRQVNAGPKDNELKIPFPAGQPMTVAITNQTPQSVTKIEDVKPPQ